MGGSAKIKYSFLCRSGLRAAYGMMKVAYEAGINFFDNAETYAEGKAEEIMGEVVKLGIQDKVWERDDLVLSTKIFFGPKKGVNAVGLSRKHVIEGTVASLKRMQLEYVDIVFCHRPDPYTPMEEVVRAFNYLIDKGLAFYWGTSEWNAQQITEACEVADKLNVVKPIADQCEYSLIKREKVDGQYKPLYEKYGYGTTIWSPLASGMLTGKYSGGKVPDGARLSLSQYEFLQGIYMTEDVLDSVDKCKPIAEELGCSMAQLAFGFAVVNPQVSTVLLVRFQAARKRFRPACSRGELNDGFVLCPQGASSVKQLEENLKACDVADKMTPDVIARIEDIFKTKPKLDPFVQWVDSVRLAQ